MSALGQKRTSRLLDHHIGSGEQRLRNGEAECLRGLEVDYQLELGRLLHGWGRSSPHACAIKKSLSAGS